MMSDDMIQHQEDSKKTLPKGFSKGIINGDKLD